MTEITGKRVVIETIRSNDRNISLYKNPPSPNIYYYFTHKGRSLRGSTKTDNLEKAKNYAIKTCIYISDGYIPNGNQKNSRFDEVCKNFLRHKKEDRKITSRTLEDYKTQSRYLLERFGKRYIKDLCSRTVYSDYTEWRRKYYQNHETKRKQRYKKYGRDIEGREFITVGNVRINRECRLLVSILRYGKEKGLLPNIEIPTYKMLPERRREEILTHEEYEKLKNYWEEKNPYYWMIISFVNNTGIRYPSELNRIVWNDINLDKSYVLIRDRKTKNKETKPLHSPVPLVGRSREIIEILKSRDGIPKGSNDHVFVNDKGRQVMNIKRSFKIGLKECGIEKNLTMYSLRHLFTTRMVKRSDIPLKVLSEVLGHKDTTMLNEHYSHLRVEDLVNVFQRSEDKKQEILKHQEDRKTE